MYTKKIYFSGSNIRELQAVFAGVEGVLNVITGNISAKNVRSYVNHDLQTLEGISAVEIEFNPKKTDLSTLMDILFNVRNPYADENLGVYYATGEDEPQIELHLNFIANRGREPVVSKACLTINDPHIDKIVRKCVVKVGRLINFKSDLTKGETSLRF